MGQLLASSLSCREEDSRKSQLRSERLQTVEDRLKFWARLRVKWNLVEHSEGENVERMWEEFRGGILVAVEEVYEKC